VPKDVGFLINNVLMHYPRSIDPSQASPSRRTRTAESVETPLFPFHWVNDIPAFRKDVREFINQPINYRSLPEDVTNRRRYDPPSTGNIPARSACPIAAHWKYQANL